MFCRTVDGMAGLRERKKQETRAAISDAALRLAVAHGFENVLVEDIAAEANVSPRTVNNYFSSKQEAIVSRATDRARQAADALRERPATEPLWEALAHAIGVPYERASLPGAERLSGIRLLLETPALRAEYLRVFQDGQKTLAAAVAERTGLDPEHDLYPALVAAVATAAEGVATDRWLHADPPTEIMPLLREALRQIAAGLPEPAAKKGPRRGD